MRRSIRASVTACCALAWASGAYASCTSAVFFNQGWRPPDVLDSIKVQGDVSCVDFALDGQGRWGMTIDTGTSSQQNGWAHITVSSDVAVNLGSVTVVQGSGGEVWAIVSLDETVIGDVGCVAIGANTLDRLWLIGGIQGDLERVDITEIGEGTA